MPFELPDEILRLLADQGQTIARSQAIDMGLDRETVRNRLRYGEWQQLKTGVYAAFTGVPKREAEIWAALLRAGPGATLSHWTAAERHGLVDKPSPAIHVTVPAECHPARWAKIPGIVIHRSRGLERARHPAMTPPCTRIEHTVLDLIEAAGSFDEAYDWICRAVGRRRTTAERIRATMDVRPKMPGKEFSRCSNCATSGASSARMGCRQRNGRPGSGRKPATGTWTTSTRVT
jgi:predicted transcriptional regulator of viral defense system